MCLCVCICVHVRVFVCACVCMCVCAQFSKAIVYSGNLRDIQVNSSLHGNTVCYYYVVSIYKDQVQVVSEHRSS